MSRVEDWEGDEGTARVSYYPPDDAGVEKVSVIEFRDAKPFDTGLVETVRWRLGRLWAWPR